MSQILDKLEENSKTLQMQSNKLLNHVNTSIPRYEKLKNLNRNLSVRLGVLSIVLSLGATISGIFYIENARIAATFGACATAIQGVLFAYPVDKRARVYRLTVDKLNNLVSDLEVKNNRTDEELQRLLEEFKAIRLEAALEEGSSGNLAETLSRIKELLKESEQRKI